MNVAPEAGALVDPSMVRAFVRMVHDAAARALEGAVDPGMLQLDFLHPNGGATQSTRFPIGAVDAMADSAISAAEGGLNVYVEGRTVDVRVSAGRGKANATRGLFAFVNDSDGDKGKAGTLPIAPTWSVESSPGNRHDWIVLDRALTAGEAEPLGRSLRKLIGSDSATAKLTQPYRVAGTPNFPDARKRARGRTVTATRILSTDGPLYTAATLAEAFPPIAEPDPEASASSAGRSGATSGTFEDLIAEEGADRSTRFHAAVRVAFRAGLLRGDVEDAMRRHPGGCAGKYLKPDRLVEEIARSWAKVEAEAATEAKATSEPVSPTYPSAAVPVEEARATVAEKLAEHFAAGTGVRALKISTGTGKSRAAVKAVVANVRRRRAEGDKSATLYLAPHLALADEIRDLFRAEGVTAETFRGRGQPDPDAEGFKMCLDMEAVELALKLDLTVATACCKLKDRDTGVIYHCPHFSACSYQRQITETPDIWLASHEMLWTAPSGLGEIGSLVVDEGFASSALRIGTRGMTLDEVGTQPAPSTNNFEMLDRADVAAWRSMLKAALGRQESVGGVERRHLVEGGLTAEICANAGTKEWRAFDSVAFWPGMSKDARQAAARAAVAKGRIGKITSVWRAARALLEQPDEAAVSGRLILVDKQAEDGFGKARAVLVHGLKPVLKRWLDIPVVMLDATLPPIEVLRHSFPDVEITADVESKAPHAAVRQVLGTPTSHGKLHGTTAPGGEAEVKRALQAVRRAVILRWVRAGRPKTLVTAQKDTAAALRTLGMPDDITLGHYGALSGLDGFKDVGLLIAIGRAMPDPLKVETMAGAMTGLEPLRAARPDKGGFFHDRVPLALRMADGTGRGVEGYRHPDPIAEALRWQSAEGGVLQAVGRARAVNRTAADPVEIEVWSDLALPLTVDDVVQWDDVPAGYEADMVADGVWLESPSDMSACWPGVWSSEKAARQWRDRRARSQTPIEESLYKGLGPCSFRYQRQTVGAKWRQGYADPDVVPDPRGWLEARLGELRGFEIVDRG